MPEPVYFTVVADFEAFVEDSASDDADYNPQIVPIGGTVTFTPLLNTGDVVLATQASPRPKAYVPTVITAIIDPVDGRLKMRVDPDEGSTGGEAFAPVRLLGSSDLLELDGPLSYAVQFSNVTYAGGRRASINGFTFEAPNQDIELNLITVMHAPSATPASGITKIAPTAARFENGFLVWSFAGVDIPDPLPLSEIKGAATVSVGDVVTGPAGSSVSVTNSGTAEVAVLDFSIPKGDKGDAGTVAVGSVTTGAAYSSAAVTNAGDSHNAVLNFTIPRGIPGATNTAPDTHNAQSKTTPVDADEMPLVDSAGSWGLKKLTWANLKSAIGSWYDSAARTLTNKTLTNPVISTIKDSAGSPTLSLVPRANAVNYLAITNSAVGTDVEIGPTGSDGNIGFKLGGRGYSKPTTIIDGQSNEITEFQPSGASAVNHVKITNAYTGTAPKIEAAGDDANVSLNIRGKGSGTVQINGVEAVTTTGAQSLTNKTISGASNTITNLPASATPDAARLVCATAPGAVGSENGANTWAKIATFSTAETTNADINVVLLVTFVSTPLGMDSAVVAVKYRSSSTGLNPLAAVEIISKSGAANQIGPDSFKLISGGFGSTSELWIKKQANYGQARIYELSVGGNSSATVTYNSGAAWQAAEPVGAVNNVKSNGVTAFGEPVVTTTGTQALSNKTWVSASVPATATSTGTTGRIAYDANYVYICTATNTWRRSPLSSW